MAGDTPRRHSPFPKTRWPEVSRAAQEMDQGNPEALGQLLAQYMPALKAHLVMGRGVAPDRADDLVQGFVQTKILQQGLIDRADRTRGKFRSLLLSALSNYVNSVVRREKARKRSPAGAPILNIDDHADEALSSSPPSAVFDVAWGREVLAEAVRRTQAWCEQAGRADVWGVFENRLLRPTLDQGEPLPYEQLVERYGLESPAQAANLLITAKRIFARELRAVVARYAGNASDVDAEIADLRAALSRPGAAPDDKESSG